MRPNFAKKIIRKRKAFQKRQSHLRDFQYINGVWPAGYQPNQGLSIVNIKFNSDKKASDGFRFILCDAEKVQ